MAGMEAVADGIWIAEGGLVDFYGFAIRRAAS